MRRLVRILVVGLTLVLVVGVAPATAGTSHHLDATFDDGAGVPPNYNPIEVAARCPAQSEWIFAGAGEGRITAASLGLDESPFNYEFDYCSRWVTFDPERPHGRYVGKAEAGRLTISIDGGEELYVDFEGTWTFDGALAPPAFTAYLRLHYTITDGTGRFAGATGNGRLHLETTHDETMTPVVDTLEGQLNGSIHVR